MIRFRRENFHEGDGKPEENTYQPNFPAQHEEAMKAGHGGGDYFMNYNFAEAIRRNEPPYLDVYRGVAMSIVGPLAYRSALADSAPLDVPDFRRESDRRQFANDHWSPDPTARKKGDPWPSIRGPVKPSPKALAYAKGIWRKMGYRGE